MDLRRTGAGRSVVHRSSRGFAARNAPRLSAPPSGDAAASKPKKYIMLSRTSLYAQIFIGVASSSAYKTLVTGTLHAGTNERMKVGGYELGLVGIDPLTGNARFSFGIPQLLDGVDVMILVIGLFAVGEALYQAWMQ